MPSFVQFKTLRAILLFMMGCGLSVVLSETVLHLIEATPLWRVLPIVERELGIPDDKLGYRFLSERRIINVREHRTKVSTNSHQMRDRVRNLAKPTNTFRIALFGDSYTEALQVAEPHMFSQQTERRLNERDKKMGFEVLNFGMSGFGPLQQLLRFRQDGILFSPDLSVFVLGAQDFLNQELSNDQIGPAYIYDDAGDLVIGYGFRTRTSQRLQTQPVGQLFFWIMNHSRVARAVYLRLKIGNLAKDRVRINETAISCASFGAALLPHINLWDRAQPEDKAARLARYIRDLGNGILNPTTPKHVALYGLPIIPPHCAEELRLRTALSQTIKTRLNDYQLGFTDVDQALMRLDPNAAVQRAYYGFGTGLGDGHLNYLGHAAYAEILTQIVLAYRNY